MIVHLNIAQVAANIRVLGYGNRAGVWVQGCSIGCPGCSSLHTHNPVGGRQLEISKIIDWLRAQPCSLVGLTVSGGEPSAQNNNVLELIQAFRNEFKQADVLMFSGLPWRRLITQHSELVKACDVIIAGPYVKNLPPRPLRGSSNQTVHLLTDLAHERYYNLDRWPTQLAQAVFSKESVISVGIPNTDELTKNLLGIGSIDPNTASWTQYKQGASQ
jgi:anaerobic ribonucleoside-triphosphate reductase activating protein